MSMAAVGGTMMTKRMTCRSDACRKPLRMQQLREERSHAHLLQLLLLSFLLLQQAA